MDGIGRKSSLTRYLLFFTAAAVAANCRNLFLVLSVIAPSSPFFPPLSSRQTAVLQNRLLIYTTLYTSRVIVEKEEEELLFPFPTTHLFGPIRSTHQQSPLLGRGGHRKLWAI